MGGGVSVVAVSVVVVGAGDPVPLVRVVVGVSCGGWVGSCVGPEGSVVTVIGAGP